MKTRALAVLLVVGLAAAACGSAEEPAAPASAGEGGDIFPAVDVVRLNTGETVDFASQLAGGDQAILVWFWAPH